MSIIVMQTKKWNNSRSNSSSSNRAAKTTKNKSSGANAKLWISKANMLRGPFQVLSAEHTSVLFDINLCQTSQTYNLLSAFATQREGT